MDSIYKHEIFEEEYKKLEEAYLKAFNLLESDLLAYTEANLNAEKVKSDEAAVQQVERNYLDMSIFELSDKISTGIPKTGGERQTLQSHKSGTLCSGNRLEGTEHYNIETIHMPESRQINLPNMTTTEEKPQKARVGEEAKAEVAQEAEPEKTADELLAEMDALVGLDTVKKDIRSMINFIRVCKLREERGMKAPKLSYHMVFSGNPGTGKTTIARMLAQLYKAIGVLPKGQLVEVDRSGLIAGYQGQTAIKTAEVIKSAMGGVLFIDEAYALADSDNDTYGKECIATILKAMEDYRDELIVIVAGYDELMHKFIDSNPGLKSRFNKYINFPDYSGEEMEKIFMLQCDSNGYELEAEARELLRAIFDDWYETRDENFGNGRTVRNSFEKIINCQATRLAEDADISDEELRLLTVQDVKDGLELSPEE